MTLAFIVGAIGLIWQGVIVTLGGEVEPSLVAAFSTVLLATIGIGIKKSDDDDSGG
jgi:hypothetical protein